MFYYLISQIMHTTWGFVCIKIIQILLKQFALYGIRGSSVSINDQKRSSISGWFARPSKIGHNSQQIISAHISEYLI